MFRSLALYTDPAKRLQNMRSAVDALEQISPDVQREAITFELQLRKYLAISGEEADIDIQMEFFEKLSNSKTRMAALSKRDCSQVYIVLSASLLGCSSSRFVFSLSHTQLQKGASAQGKLHCILLLHFHCSSFITVEGCRISFESLKGVQTSSMQYVVRYGHATSFVSFISLSWVNAEEVNANRSRILGDDGQRMIDWACDYDFESFHAPAARRSVCHHHQGAPLIVLEHYAEVDLFDQLVDEWLKIDRKAQLAGVSNLIYPSVCVWPNLSTATLNKTMEFWSISWRSAASCVNALQPQKYAFVREEGDKVFKYLQHEGLLLNVTMTMLAKIPQMMRQADAMDALPQIDYAGFDDHMFELHSYAKPPHVLAAQAAKQLGLDRKAEQYGRKALTRHLNPVRIYRTHAELGSVQATPWDNVGGNTESDKN